MTKRKQAIIEWLSCDDVATVAQRHFEHGQYGIGAMSMATFDVHSFDITTSQLRSLYATLAIMVKDGLLTRTYQTVEGTNACYRETHWHLVDRLERDSEIMMQLDRIGKERQAKAALNFFG
jgi:hypothetical protein